MNKRQFKNCFEAVCFLDEHLIFQDGDGLGHFDDCFQWEVHMVSPVSGKICQNGKRNTEQTFWLAASPWKKPEELSEEMRMLNPYGATYTVEQVHAKGRTYESAMIDLAKKIRQKFGDYEVK